MIVPILGLLIFWVSFLIAKGADEDYVGYFDSPVTPVNFYLANMITPKWQTSLEDFFYVTNTLRYNMWSSLDSEAAEKFKYMLSIQSDFHTYNVTDTTTNKTEKMPRFTHFEETASIIEDAQESMNSRLIKVLKDLNEVEASKMKYDETLPDGTMILKSFSNETGFNMHLQVNTIASARYRRRNGMTKVYMLSNSGNS